LRVILQLCRRTLSSGQQRDGKREANQTDRCLTAQPPVAAIA
jgi:hypothetical protein